MFKVKKTKSYQKRICGIDPGMTGGIAVAYRDENGFLELEGAMMMPVIEVMGNKCVDGGAIVRALNTWKVSQTIIEYVNSFPGQGVASSFQFGRMFGGIEGAVRTAEFPVYVSPGKWKADMGLPKQKIARDKYIAKGIPEKKAKAKSKKLAKKQAIKMATNLFGEKVAEMYWSLAKEDGVAEAALIAAWYIQENDL